MSDSSPESSATSEGSSHGSPPPCDLVWEVQEEILDQLDDDEAKDCAMYDILPNTVEYEIPVDNTLEPANVQVQPVLMYTARGRLLPLQQFIDHIRFACQPGMHTLWTDYNGPPRLRALLKKLHLVVLNNATYAFLEGRWYCGPEAQADVAAEMQRRAHTVSALSLPSHHTYGSAASHFTDDLWSCCGCVLYSSLIKSLLVMKLGA